jgi:hypothetical protein
VVTREEGVHVLVPKLLLNLVSSVGLWHVLLKLWGFLIVVVVHHDREIEGAWKARFNCAILFLVRIISGLSDVNFNTMLRFAIEFKFTVQDMNGPQKIVVVFLGLVENLPYHGLSMMGQTQTVVVLELTNVEKGEGKQKEV